MSNKKKISDSRLQVFIKIGVFKNFVILTGKHQRWSLFIHKVAGFVTKKVTLTPS